VRQGWSLKALHRLIMTSNTYRQSSTVEPRHEQLDPANHLLSRMSMRRMEAEELRDSLLLVAGELDPTRFGPPQPVKVRADGLVLGGKRRSVYVEQLRKHPLSLLESFDLPAMNPNCLQRTDSLVAPQALHLLNDSGIRELAKAFADRVREEAGEDRRRQVEQIYWIALSRPPSAEEMEICLESLKAVKSADAALPSLCRTIMNSAAFLYID